MQERREQTRVETVSRVKISHTTFGSLKAMTRNISSQGLYIELSDQPHLPVGAHIQLNMLDSARPDVAFNVKVLRTDKQGVALKFVDYEVEGERFDLSQLNLHWKTEAG